MNKWTNKDWTIEQMNKWTNVQMNKWINEQMNKWTNERIKKWTNEQMNKWTNDQMIKWSNEQVGKIHINEHWFDLIWYKIRKREPNLKTENWKKTKLWIK